MLNLDAFLSFRLNKGRIGPISALKNFADKFTEPWMDANLEKIFYFGGSFIILLFIADIHVRFHIFFIMYVMYAIDSGGIFFFWLCILTVLTM
jgi:hypothetical protein